MRSVDVVVSQVFFCFNFLLYAPAALKRFLLHVLQYDTPCSYASSIAGSLDAAYGSNWDHGPETTFMLLSQGRAVGRGIFAES